VCELPPTSREARPPRLLHHVRLRVDKRQAPRHGGVAEEELRAPQDLVGNHLEEEHAGEGGHGGADLGVAAAEEDQRRRCQLANEVQAHEGRGAVACDAPGRLDVRRLVTPLRGHAVAVLDEGREEESPRDGLDVVLAGAQGGVRVRLHLAAAQQRGQRGLRARPEGLLVEDLGGDVERHGGDAQCVCVCVCVREREVWRNGCCTWVLCKGMCEV